MFRLFTAILEDQVEYALKRAVAPLAPYLRRLTMGVVTLMIASGGFMLGLLFLILALFFSLSVPLEQFTRPALIVGGSSVVLGIMVSLIGVKLLRSPKR